MRFAEGANGLGPGLGSTSPSLVTSRIHPFGVSTVVGWGPVVCGFGVWQVCEVVAWNGPLPGSLSRVEGVWGHYAIESSRYQVWGFRLVYGEILARGAAEVHKVGHVASGAHYIDGCGHI